MLVAQLQDAGLPRRTEYIKQKLCTKKVHHNKKRAIWLGWLPGDRSLLKSKKERKDKVYGQVRVKCYFKSQSLHFQSCTICVKSQWVSASPGYVTAANLVSDFWGDVDQPSLYNSSFCIFCSSSSPSSRSVSSSVSTSSRSWRGYRQLLVSRHQQDPSPSTEQHLICSLLCHHIKTPRSLPPELQIWDIKDQKLIPTPSTPAARSLQLDTPHTCSSCSPLYPMYQVGSRSSQQRPSPPSAPACCTTARGS